MATLVILMLLRPIHHVKSGTIHVVLHSQAFTCLTEFELLPRFRQVKATVNLLHFRLYLHI